MKFVLLANVKMLCMAADHKAKHFGGKFEITLRLTCTKRYVARDV